MDQLSAYIALAAGVSYLAKLCVDLARLGADLPRWGPPLLALMLGIVFSFLLQLAAGVAISGQLAAQCVIVGVLGAGGAVGVTELARKADAKPQP